MVEAGVSGDAIRAGFGVAAPIDQAFRVFTEGFATWYPREYTWSQDVLVAIGIEPGEGGHCIEVGPHGFRIDWGRVIAWEPPARLVFSWQINGRREPVPEPVDGSIAAAGPAGAR